MPTHAVVWDLETVPDLKGFAAANDLVSKSDDEIREARWATIFPNTSFTRLLASADNDQGQCPIWIIRDRSIQRGRYWMHSGQWSALAKIRHRGCCLDWPHMAATRGASNDPKYKLFGYVR